MSDEPTNLTKWQKKGMDLMLADIDNLVNGLPHKIGTFIVGPGGTGKSYLLDCLIKTVNRIHPTLKIYMTATTGAAASRLNGARTLAKFLCIGGDSMKLDKYDEILKAIKKGQPKTLRDVNILIIDEVSMLSRRQFENLNQLLVDYRDNPDEWGGVYVIFVGDPFQLPPIPHDKGPGSYRKATEFVPSCLERNLAGFNYIAANELKRSEGCPLLRRMILSLISDDPKVCHEAIQILLDNCYRGKMSVEDVLRRQKETGATILTTAKEGEYSVAHYNYASRQMNEVDGTTISEEIVLPPVEKTHEKLSKEARDTMLKEIGGEGELRKEESAIEERDTWPKDGVVRTKTPYMIRANLITKEEVSVCNGDQGEILSYDSNTKTIRFQLYKSREIITLPIHIFHSEWVDTIGFKAFPLIESSAMTVHKSQGATCRSGVILELRRLYNGEYLAHMLYTACSRVTSIHDICITSYILPDILNTPEIRKKMSFVWKLGYMNEYLRPTDV